MLDQESSSARYRRLAQGCLETAQGFPEGEQRKTLLQMAQVWLRLADTHANARVSRYPPMEGKQPPMQQQQQVQPKDDDEKE